MRGRCTPIFKNSTALPSDRSNTTTRRSSSRRPISPRASSSHHDLVRRSMTNDRWSAKCNDLVGGRPCVPIMNVADAMTPREALVTVSVPGTRDDALTYLQEREFSSIPVVKGEGSNEEFRGLVSRQTLIEHPDEDELALLVEDGPTTTADTTIEAVAREMVTTGARRVPVVNEHLNGIITIT